MNLGLENKRALVLASSSGLGQAVATELAREGARVAICSRDLGRVQETAKTIEKETSGNVHAFEADVTQDASIGKLITDTVAALGGLDILVCNAGGPPPGNFEALTEDKWDHAYQLTLQSVVRSIRHALPHLEKANDAAILAIASSSIKRPIPNLLLSNVYRPAIHALTNALADEFASKGIRVNCLAPGRIGTDRVDELDQAKAKRLGKTFEEVREASLKTIPMGRLGEPAEFGRIAAFMLSPAASYLTGSSIIADGGMVRAL